MKIVLQVVFALLALPGVAYAQLLIYKVEHSQAKTPLFLGVNLLDDDSFSLLHLIPQPQRFVVASEIAFAQKSEEGKTLTVYHADKTVELIKYKESLETLPVGSCTNGTKIHRTKLYALLACKADYKDKDGKRLIQMDVVVSEKGVKKETLQTFHEPAMFSLVYRSEFLVFEKRKLVYKEIRTFLMGLTDSPPEEPAPPPPSRQQYDKALVYFPAQNPHPSG